MYIGVLAGIVFQSLSAAVFLIINAVRKTDTEKNLFMACGMSSGMCYNLPFAAGDGSFSDSGTCLDLVVIYIASLIISGYPGQYDTESHKHHYPGKDFYTRTGIVL